MIIEQNPILNLQLFDQRDSSSIAIIDNSTYTSVPTSGQIAFVVTPPGYPSINLTFVPGVVNVYKCVDLGITCSDSGCTPLPDGIYDVNYTVVVSNSPNASVDLKFIKIDQIKCRYEHAFLKLNVEYSCHDHTSDKYLKELKRAKLYLDGCVAACNANNYVLSNELYQKCDFILKHLCSFFKSINYQSNCNSGVGYGSLISCGCH